MNKILLIIQREYLTRVKKKSFIVMTIVGPVLLATLMIVPIWLSQTEQSINKIEVVDESFIFLDNIPSTENVKFEYPPVSIQQAQRGLYDSDYSAILYIPKNIIEGGGAVKLFYKKQLGIMMEQFIKSSLEKMLYELKLSKNNIDKNILKNAETSVRIITEKQNVSGKTEKTNTELYMAIGIGSGVLIYMFIFLYGVQVMRGVIEEKSNRIIEVIISSVKPFQLMMGKIIGVALVGLTQFLLWLILTLTLYTFVQTTFFRDVNEKVAMQSVQKEQVFRQGSNINAEQIQNMQKPDKLFELFDGIKSIDFKAILFCFIFYFLGGYLLYSALFAAVGAAVDNEADTQQFMLPITIPLVFSFVMAQTIIQNPESSMAFWFSIFPLTSPVIMMVRLPFGVPVGEILLSMGLLVLGFIATTWLAGRIYRTGILMYGKKVNYKEIWKWLFYKA